MSFGAVLFASRRQLVLCAFSAWALTSVEGALLSPIQGRLSSKVHLLILMPAAPATSASHDYQVALVLSAIETVAMATVAHVTAYFVRDRVEQWGRSYFGAWCRSFHQH